MPEADPPPRLVEVDPEPRRLRIDVIPEHRVRSWLGSELQRRVAEPTHDRVVDGACSSPAQAVMQGPKRGQESKVVRGTDRVKGGPHERRLHDRAIRERPIEIVGGEVSEPRPQRDGRRRGLLGLEAGEGLDRSHDVEGRGLEQVLPGQRRPIELDPRQADDRGRVAAPHGGQGATGVGLGGGPAATTAIDRPARKFAIRSV